MQLLRQEYKLLTELKTVFHRAAARHPAAEQLVFNLLVSGGKDSMSLLHACARIVRSTHFSMPLPVRFQVIHFDHKTRDGQSTLDAQFVTQQALSLGFPILHFSWHSNHSKNEGNELPQNGSFQSNASDWRRSVCLSLRDKHGPAWIFLTAHHAGDHAETVLMNLIRGCGKNGLFGLRQNNTELGTHRPFANWTTQSLLEYVAVRRIPYREDATNALACYTRNAVRHSVLPALRQLNPKIEEALLQMSANLMSGADATNSVCNAEHADITLSAGEIYDLIKRDYPQYNRLLTSQQVLNISRHSAEASRSRNTMSPKKSIKIPLSKGWYATNVVSQLKLYPPNQAINTE